MSDRGEYRAIHIVMLDGKDFQALHADARFCFLVLALTLGSTGIACEYPEAIHARLAHQTGLGVGEVQIALEVLKSRGYLRMEDNLVWVVDHLTHEPSLNVNDKRHRIHVQQHVNGLPSRKLRDDFVRHYSAWFEGPSGDLRRAQEGPSKQTTTTTTTTTTPTTPAGPSAARGVTDPPGNGTAADAADAYPPAFEAAWVLYPKRAGGNSKRDAFNAWKARLRQGYSPDILRAGVERYAAFCAKDGRLGTQFVKQTSTFFGRGLHFLEPFDAPAAPPRRNGVDPAKLAGYPLEVVNGEETEYGRYMAGGTLAVRS